MKVYVWRHNRRFHSHSMINEPCVHQDFYCDAVAIIVAEDKEDALRQLSLRDGWRIEDLRELEPKVYDVDKAGVIFTDIRG